MSDFKWRHFEGVIILWAVRWYCRYALSYHNLEQMMGERGVLLDHSTIYRWVQKYAPEIENRLCLSWAQCALWPDATLSPAAILAGLNRRLLGRTQGGFATCLVLRMDTDGTATLANAGHLSPFRDGLEWDVPASLPLGLVADAAYDEIHTRLSGGETVTLITDGVLEARNREGELYGFERVAALMRERPSAEQVAEAACRSGQDDDITVLSVTREPRREPFPTYAGAQLTPAL